MAVKADAWRDYQKAAKVSMWLEAMPKMAAEVAAPLSQVNRVTMVANVDAAAPGESLGRIYFLRFTKVGTLYQTAGIG